MPSEKPDSFQCGAFSVAKNPDVTQFVDKLNRLREMIDSCRIQQGTGYTFTRSSGGTTLSIKPQPATISSENHAWRVSLGSNTSGFYYTVATGSYLSGVTISNINSNITVSTASLTESYHAILNVTVTTMLSVASAMLKAVKVSQYEGEIVPVGDIQEENNTILATINTDGSVTQSVRSNMLFVVANSEGYAVKMAMPIGT